MMLRLNLGTRITLVLVVLLVLVLGLTRALVDRQNIANATENITTDLQISEENRSIGEPIETPHQPTYRPLASLVVGPADAPGLRPARGPPRCDGRSPSSDRGRWSTGGV